MGTLEKGLAVAGTGMPGSASTPEISDRPYCSELLHRAVLTFPSDSGHLPCVSRQWNQHGLLLSFQCRQTQQCHYYTGYSPTLLSSGCRMSSLVGSFRWQDGDVFESPRQQQSSQPAPQTQSGLRGCFSLHRNTCTRDLAFSNTKC